jgi:hypothetical protein
MAVRLIDRIPLGPSPLSFLPSEPGRNHLIPLRARAVGARERTLEFVVVIGGGGGK